jgi:hypothetical protein
MKLGNNHLTATVTRVYYSEGGPLYDVRSNDGATFRGVRVRGMGESFYPVTVGQEVHLLRPRGAYDPPYIVGADLTSIVESTPSASTSEDYSPDSEDLQIRHADNTLSLSESGVTVSTSVFRVQGGPLRVSLNGDAPHSVLRGQQFVDALFAYIAELETAIGALQTQVATLSGAAGVPNVASVPPSSSATAKANAEQAITNAIKVT